MAFGMSPFPLQFGTRGGGGAASDPTVLTPAILAALGFAYTRTGEVYGRRAPGGPGNYVRHATNDPEFDFTEVDGKNYPSLIVRGEATPLISYSADLTNAAWTKTGAMTALALGGLEHGPEWRGSEQITGPWTQVGNGITESGGIITMDGGTYEDDRVAYGLSIPTGRFFTGTFEVYDYVSGSFNLALAGYSVLNLTVNANGTYTFLSPQAAPFPALWFYGTAICKIRNISVKECDARSLVTATADNATVTRQLTRASAPRRSRVRIAAPATNVGSVLVSHGRPTGAALHEDLFNSDTSGSYIRGTESVDGTFGVSGGVLTYTAGAGDGLNPRLVIAKTVTVGKTYNIRTTGVSGTGTARVRVYSTSLGGGPLFGDAYTGVSSYFKATQPTVYITLILLAPSAGQTGIFNDWSLDEISETEVPAGTFADLELTEYTGANPQLAIRLTNNADTAEVYDFQHAELGAGVPMPNFVPQGATPAAVGADLTNKTYGDDLTDIDISILFKAPPTTNLRYVLAFNNFAANANPMIGIRSISGNIGTYRGSGGGTTATIVSSFTPGQLYLLDMQANATHFRVRERGGSWQGLGAIPSGIRQFLVGQLDTTVTLDVPIAAMQDNNGNVFGTPGVGFNISAIGRYEASL